MDHQAEDQSGSTMVPERGPERCHLCEAPFASDPFEDFSEFDHHYCRHDRLPYCTPCYMQLFFEGYFDLSYGDPEVAERHGVFEGEVLVEWAYTHVGHSVRPYEKRLAAKGFQLAATLIDGGRPGFWEEVVRVCRLITKDGDRYLVLGEEGLPHRSGRYLVYRSVRCATEGGSHP